MKINQDSFKEGKLNFGMRGSTQRLNVNKYRIDTFREAFIDDFPEYFIKLQCDKFQLYTYIEALREIHFKDKHKLAYSLEELYMETVSSVEFEVIMRRFNRYLKLSQFRYEDLEDLFSKSLR